MNSAPTETELLIERLNRWAENLPVSETIPVFGEEALILAEFEDSLYGFADNGRISKFVDAIVNGRFTYRGHRIVLI